MAASDLDVFGAAREGERMRIGRILLCMVLLAPISLTVADDGVSANYLFALLLISPQGYRQNAQAAAYILFMTVALGVGIILFSHFDGVFLLRQFISYMLWLLGVLLLFVRLGIRLEEFLLAAVLCALVYSLVAFLMFTVGGFSLSDVYSVKGGMREFITDWPQRYVVVLIFAFFVALGRWHRGILWAVADIVILGCIFLTFTRAAWLGVAAGLVAYVVLMVVGTVRSAAVSATSQKVVLVAGLVLSLGVVSYAALNPDIAEAFDTIYANMVDVSETDTRNFRASQSEGDRLDLYSAIIDTVETNPFTGTGFAGAYLVISGEGSAHGQLFDVLLRTGGIGLLIYLLFYGKLLRFYYRADIGIAAGMIALFVFGLFHETTKLSYGSLIFFFLLNKVYESRERRGTVKRAASA